jgi:hypothetical protein
MVDFLQLRHEGGSSRGRRAAVGLPRALAVGRLLQEPQAAPDDLDLALRTEPRLEGYDELESSGGSVMLVVVFDYIPESCRRRRRSSLTLAMEPTKGGNPRNLVRGSHDSLDGKAGRTSSTDD